MPRSPIPAAAALLCAGLAAPAALAQGACPESPPAPEPCLVGSWIGTNTVGKRVEEMLRRFAPAEADRIVQQGLPETLGITVLEDGLYVTQPLQHWVTVIDVTEHDTITVDMDLDLGAEVGQLWTEAGQLRFCSFAATSPELRILAESGLGGTAQHSITGAHMMPSEMRPLMYSACSGDRWKITVQLPDPVGSVDYDLVRVSDDRLPDPFRLALDALALAREGG